MIKPSHYELTKYMSITIDNPSEISKQIISDIWQRVVKNPEHYIHEKYSHPFSERNRIQLIMDTLAEVAISLCGSDKHGLPIILSLPEDVGKEYVEMMNTWEGREE